MQYIDFTSGEGPEGLVIKTRSIPTVKAGEILIKVAAFGVNRADTLQRQGKYPPPPGESDILGLEVSGEVVQVGDNVTQWHTGDRVCALVAGGGYAEYVTVNAAHVIPIPQNVSLVDAAGLTEVYLTAWQALFAIGGLKASDKALIHAGASGVGLAALQLCRYKGVETATTASSTEKLNLCTEMGASLTINYRDEDFAAVLKEQWRGGVNFILDFIGGDYLNRNLKVLAQDGKVVYLAMLGGRYADQLDMALLLAKRATIEGSTLRNRTDEYKASLIADFIQKGLPGFASGALQVNVDTVLNVDAVAEAHRLLESNQTKGKVIVRWG
ncbi:NAD(P)H-quinone oxidoreductase [Alteromonas sp. C1M14]|uniref:NAD(P)H-quinone oxidoreductase n=1 Tax=Alteromonas sp. C1M14 TaxID=2841567 RepID=UPI001C0A1B69|nr:NAD(P)H-quinone oxidoreductase [Alteromonas sp. C1M14]MBU2978989.1 NAD(P)H-quinone oxidoreductase [Alteromonas sp. C1M14]